MRDLSRIRRKFGMYATVEGRAIFVGEQSPDINQLVEAFEELVLFSPSGDPRSLYRDAAETIEDKTYSKEQIRTFVAEELPEIEIEHSRIAGVYVSALINKLLEEGDSIDLSLSEVRHKLHALGYRSKGITYNIHGDVGEFVGGDAKGCTFNIYGDVGSDAGAKAEDCVFNIKGDAGINLGTAAVNSTYQVKGNTNVCYHNSGNDKWVSSLGIDSKNCKFKIRWRDRLAVPIFLAVEKFMEKVFGK